MDILAMAVTATPTPIPIDVIRQTAAPTDWTAVMVAWSSLAAAVFALASTALLAVAGVLTFNQLRLARLAANAATAQLTLTASQLSQQAGLETNRRTLDLINEIDADRLADILKTIFPTMVIASDEAVAIEKIDAYIAQNRDLSDPRVDRSYFDALNRISNYFDKANLYLRSLVADDTLFLSYYAPLIIRLYATFRHAYYESPRFPRSEGLHQLAKTALAAYRELHVGTPEAQFAQLDFD